MVLCCMGSCRVPFATINEYIGLCVSILRVKNTQNWQIQLGTSKMSHFHATWSSVKCKRDRGLELVLNDLLDDFIQEYTSLGYILT